MPPDIPEKSGEKSPDLNPEISWNDWKSLRTMCCDSWMIFLLPSQTTRLKTICAWSKCNRRCRDASDPWTVPKYSAAYAVTSRPAGNKASLRWKLCACSPRGSGLPSWQALPQHWMVNSYIISIYYVGKIFNRVSRYFAKGSTEKRVSKKTMNGHLLMNLDRFALSRVSFLELY